VVLDPLQRSGASALAWGRLDIQLPSWHAPQAKIDLVPGLLAWHLKPVLIASAAFEETEHGSSIDRFAI
jgi:hypothetical protein